MNFSLLYKFSFVKLQFLTLFFTPPSTHELNCMKYVTAFISAFFREFFTIIYLINVNIY